ncbi:MAG: transporter, ATP-binding protein [Acidobacteriaceae bacterium]|nr:transporter, ATP-binding protein [Acidobacteriaceae bacterium]
MASAHEANGSFAELRDVHVARGDSIVLHGIDLVLGRGEHAVILGPNGCGKSSLIKVLTCECYPLARPGSSVRIFGRERWSVEDLRKRLGIVSADLPGPSTAHTPGADAVVCGFFASATLWPHLVVTEEMRERAAEAMALMEATHLAAKPVGEMSAGEMRRVMIARALVHRPEMLLLDEPSNALDLRAQRELRETLRRLARQGTGLLLVTHHLPDVLPEIDRVIMMRDGRIFADGPKRELLTPDRLGQLFGSPIDVVEREEYFHALA